MIVKNNARLRNKSKTSLCSGVLENTVSNISENYGSWLDQMEHHYQQEIFHRRKYMRGFKCFIQTLIGMFIKPRLSNTNNIYIFEGIRNREYMAVFNPDSVVIVGSHLEKEYAYSHGYGFCWSFPMQSAINSKMSRGWNYPAIVQLMFWTKKLSRFRRVIFFLYEDTQPLGIFFVHLTRLLWPKVSTVCIQHGYFLENTQVRLDGLLSDINFVWDKRQAELIGANKLRTFEIGLPYMATAKQSNELHVVLVGTGMAASDKDFYEKTINAYDIICRMLVNIAGVKVFYRPHPNEYNDKKLLAELSNKFLLVDEPNKIKQLNGPRAIFIGIVSSLLYEAGVAGHLVAHLKVNSNMRSVFDYDFDFEENQIGDLLQWIVSIKNNNYLKHKNKRACQLDPLERFKLALHEAELVD